MKDEPRRIVGWALIVIGFLALITPLTPGSWLIFVGAEIVGLELTFARRTAAFIDRQRDWLIPVACMLSPFIAAIIGGAFTASALPTWYAALTKPTWIPPDYLFGLVWTALYLLMGIAALIVYRTGRPERGFVLAIFFAHLVVNALWPVVFFGAHALNASVAVIIVLWTMIAWLIIVFGRLSRTAGWLLVPYLVWVSYAAALTIALAFLNA